MSEKECYKCRFWLPTTSQGLFGDCEIDMETKTCSNSCCRFEQRVTQKQSKEPTK